MAYAIFYYIISSQRFITIKEVANAASSKAEREEEAKQQKGKQKFFIYYNQNQFRT